MKKLLFATLCFTFLFGPVKADNHEKRAFPVLTETAGTSETTHFHPTNLLSPHGLERIISLAKEVSFKDDRMRLLKAALTERDVTTAQCVRLMRLADFDDERLEIIQCVAGHIADPENIDDILDELNFSSNRDKARKMLRLRY